MQKNISSRETIKETPEHTEDKIVNPRDLLIKQLGFRGLEVLTNAEGLPNHYEAVRGRLK